MRARLRRSSVVNQNTMISAPATYRQPPGFRGHAATPAATRVLTRRRVRVTYTFSESVTRADTDIIIIIIIIHTHPHTHTYTRKYLRTCAAAHITYIHARVYVMCTHPSDGPLRG